MRLEIIKGPILSGLTRVVQTYRPHLCHEGAIKHLHRQQEGLAASTRPAPALHRPEATMQAGKW